MKDKAEQLQFFRFIAFVLIFNWHMDWFAPQFLPRDLGGACAVEFFFLLSGFGSAYSSYNKDVVFTWRGVYEYLKKKLKKVYPLYFVVTFFSVCRTDLPRFIAHHKFVEAHVVAKVLIRHILLIQSWFPTGYFDFSGVGWFLSTIFFLYILNVPFRAIATKIKAHKHSDLIFSVIGLVSITGTVIYSYLLRNTYMEFTDNVLPIAHIGEYICGLCMGYLIYAIKARLSNDRKTTAVMTVLEVIALTFWIIMMYTPVIPWTYRIVHWIAPNILLIAVYGLGQGVISGLFRHKILVFLGNISFECFLIHRMIIESYITFSGVEPAGPRTNAVSLLFCLALTVLISMLVTQSRKVS